jgi:glutaredoxin
MSNLKFFYYFVLLTNFLRNIGLIWLQLVIYILRKNLMLKSSLNQNIILLSLSSAFILGSSSYGLVDAANSNQTLLPSTHSQEDRQPTNKPISEIQVKTNQLARATPNYPAITTNSNKSQIALARYLRRQKVRFYGAWWCPHCHEQKELFGKQAFKLIRYVECANANQPRQQKSMCSRANIRAYPTWRIKGKTFEGVQSLETLATLSGYRGRRNFTSR